MKKQGVVILAVLCMLSGCGLLQNKVSFQMNVPTTAFYDFKAYLPGEGPRFDAEGYARAGLSGAQALLYDELNGQLAEGQTVLTGVPEETTPQQLDEIIPLLMADHPEYFWLERHYTTYTETKGQKTRITKLEFECSLDEQELARCRQQVEAAAEELLSGARECEGEYEQALYLHDELIRWVEYDTAAYERLIGGSETAEDEQEGTIYGALVEKQAVCSGYAKAYQYLMNRLGLDCAYISGSKKGGYDHAWNLVQLENQSYYVDVTWDDPVETGEEPLEEVSHAYFCITTEEMEREHVPDDRVALPVCNSYHCNYYARNGCYLFQYVRSDVAALLIDAAQNGNSLLLKFSDEQQMQAAIADLFDNQAVFPMMQRAGVNNRSIQYIYEESTRLLKLVW